MRKHILSIALILMLALTLFAACASEDSDEPNGPEDRNQQSATEPKPGTSSTPADTTPPVTPEEIPDYITIRSRQYSTSLTELDLYRWDLSDEEIESLRYMINLESLTLEDTQISDISSLAGLTNLTRLEFRHNNQISDISPLTGLTNLERLESSSNQISDISPLAVLTNLTELDLSSNQISDLTPLAGLTNLEWLYLDSNQIRDISSLAWLTNLEILYLDENPIADWSPVGHMPTVYGRP